MDRKISRAFFRVIIYMAGILALCKCDVALARFTDQDSMICEMTLDQQYSVLDTEGPGLTVITPAGKTAEDPTYATDTLYAVTGLAWDDCGIKQVTVNGIVADLQPEGSWHCDIVLTEGVVHAVEVIAEDWTGKTAKETRYVCYDSQIYFEDFIITRWNRSMVGYESTITELVIPETFFDETANIWYRVVAIGFQEGRTPTVSEAAFSNLTHLKSVVIPGSVKRIEKYAFYNSTGLQEVNLAYGIEYFGMGVFQKCSGLKTMVIPDSVTDMGSGTFSSCYGMEYVNISRGMTQLNPSLFSSCSGLTGRIVVPDNITKIGNMAYYGCNMSEIVLPDSVTAIDENAFRQCDQLTTVFYRGDEEQWSQIAIKSGNSKLLDAEIMYQYDGNDS